jgi:zinc transporter ZupT
VLILQFGINPSIILPMFWDVFIVLILAALAGIALAPMLLKKESWMAMAISFATGTLLAIVLGHVIPHSLEMQEDSTLPYYFVGGFVLMMIFNHYIFANDPCCDHDGDHGHSGDTEEGHNHKLGLATIGAMALCTVNDGILLGSEAVTISSPLLWAMVGHKLTAAFGLYTMVKVCVKEKNLYSTFFLFLFVLLTPLIYAMTVEGILLPAALMARALGLSAGVVLYVIAVNLIPRCNELGHRFPKLVILSLIAGIVSTFYFVELSHPDEEGHGHPHSKAVEEESKK